MAERHRGAAQAANRPRPEMLNVTEVQLGEVRDEIVEVLQTWLDREVKDRYQQIDQKLDSLVAAAKGRVSVKPRLTGMQSKQSNLLTPRAMKTVMRNEAIGDYIFSGKFGSRRAPTMFGPPPRPSSDTLSTSVFDDAESRHSRCQDSSVSAFSPNSDTRVASQDSKYVSIFSYLGAWSKASNIVGATTPASSLPRRRKLSSHRYMEEVQAFIAQHQGRGHRAVMAWRFLENPYSSVWAWLYSVFIPIFVLTSVVISFLQTVEESPLRGGVGLFLQAGIEIFYAAELTVRFFVCPDRCMFFTSVYNWIDVASALPLVLRLAMDRDDLETDEHVSKSMAKSIVVTLPLVRLLKIVRRFEQFRLLMNAFSMAGEALPVLLYTLMLIAMFYSVLIYFLEPVDNFASMPEALWFIFVTMTTVGYGDKTPSSVGGRFVTVMLMICSFLYMAIPIGIVGKAFSEVWGNRDRLLLMHRIRESFLQEGFTADSMKKIVSFFDEDGDGELDLYEFKVMLQTMHVDISEERVMQLHKEIDKDGDGAINVVELINALFPKGYFEAWRYSHDAFMGSSNINEGVQIDVMEPPSQPQIFVNESPQGAPQKLRDSNWSEDLSNDAKSSNQAEGVRFAPCDHIDGVETIDLPPSSVGWSE